MRAKDTIEILLRRGCKHQAPLDPREWAQVKARCAWVKETVARLRDAKRRCDAAWQELVRDIPEDADEVEIDPPPEQAEVDALWKQLNDVVERNKWPPELYCSGI